MATNNFLEQAARLATQMRIDNANEQHSATNANDECSSSKVSVLPSASSNMTAERNDDTCTVIVGNLDNGTEFNHVVGSNIVRVIGHVDSGFCNLEEEIDVEQFVIGLGLTEVGKTSDRRLKVLEELADAADAFFGLGKPDDGRRCG